MQELQNFLKEDLEALNNFIEKVLRDTKVPLITEIAQHLMKSGGKRLRPLLTFLCAGLCNNQNYERMIRLGACIEFIHTATLLHDDVIDQSSHRRGCPSAHTLWGNEASVLVGDFLFSRAFELMVQDNSPEVFKILSQTASKIAEGELMQLMHTRTLTVDESLYQEIIGAKTASLFSAACEIGALAADSSFDTRSTLRSIGYNIGLLFQISDDILDFGLSTICLGKPQGNDLLEGKMTLPLIIAYKKATAVQRSLIETTLLEPKKFEENFSHIQRTLEETEAIADTLVFAQTIQKVALENLLKLEESPQRKLLEKAVHFSLNRC